MIQIKDLSFGYGKEKLFASVNANLQSGQLLHVAGPNGCGKSTLLSILAGLIGPQTGNIQMTADQRQYLAADHNGLFLKWSAMRNLRFWLKMQGVVVMDDFLVSTLTAWHLNHPLVLGGLPVEKFSTGMKRKLALARVAASGSKVWLLDEPVLGLDEEGQKQFAAALQKHLQDNKGCAVIVSHDTDCFAQLISDTLNLNRFKGMGRDNFK